MRNHSDSMDWSPDAGAHESSQTDARRILEDSEYDTELGLRLARDADRVVKGELTETAFHRRHHDAIVAEFGVDNRPTDPEGSHDE